MKAKKVTKLDNSVDFGFVVNDADTELETVVKMLTTEQYNNKLVGLSKILEALFSNLEKDPSKDYIYWPDRQHQIAAWREKIKIFINDKG